MTDKLTRYQTVWAAVRHHYLTGSCVSERGLQTFLCWELMKEFPESRVVVEPDWKGHDRHYIPDVVMIEGGLISDVFEIKFVPHSYPKYKNDIEKLVAYRDWQRTFPVAIDPATGKWEEPCTISKSLRIHFAVVGKHDAHAVSTSSVLQEVERVAGRGSRFFHWYGQVGVRSPSSRDWDVISGGSC